MQTNQFIAIITCLKEKKRIEGDNMRRVCNYT